jgi:hypothetical protein
MAREERPVVEEPERHVTLVDHRGGYLALDHSAKKAGVRHWHETSDILGENGFAGGKYTGMV